MNLPSFSVRRAFAGACWGLFWGVVGLALFGGRVDAPAWMLWTTAALGSAGGLVGGFGGTLLWELPEIAERALWRWFAGHDR